MPDSPTSPLGLTELAALKSVLRRGWLRVGATSVESVAAHSWGVSALVLALAPPELDRERLLTYATVHDLAEARAGDITPHDGVSRADKHAREAAAMRAIAARLPRGAAIEAAWHAYEAQSDPEAHFVRELDRLDMALQALVYAESGTIEPEAALEFVHSARRDVRSSDLCAVLDAIEDELATLRRTRTPTEN